ncbi:MAG: hypothetical protein UHM85_02720 [Acutalibacteraceae bacterium]|nr:hypothetical protein [Acutalibacteraceae bacterium]
MMSKTMIRIICIIMAVLMVLSVGAVVLQVFAVDEGAVLNYVAPVTGDSGSDYLVPAGIAVAAVLAIVLCTVLPKMKKTDTPENKAVKSAPVKKATSNTEKAKKSAPSSPKVKTVGRTVKTPLEKPEK